MKKTGASLVRFALEQMGVRHTFGIPGVHTTEIYDELNNSNQIKPVLVSHEAGAAFMADAVSRTSDNIGVTLVVPAAGLTHAMSGIGEAYLDGIAMLVLSGGTRDDIKEGYQLHQLNQQELMAPLTKATFRVNTHEEVIPTLYKAYEIAVTGEPGPVYVELPVNIQLLKGEVSAMPEFVPPKVFGAVVSDAQIDAAADMMVAADHPSIFVGWGAKKARESMIEIADLLGAPVCTSLQGLGVFPHEHTLFAGMGFGPSSVPAAENAFAGSDAMLAVGVRFAEIATGSFGSIPPENLVHIDINAKALSANYPAKIGIEGDACDVMPRLAKAIATRVSGPRNRQDLKAKITADRKAYAETWAKHDSGSKVNPGLFFAALNASASKDAQIVADDGNHTFLTAELMPISGRRNFISPTDFNCMGYAVPASNAVKLENPNRQVLAIIGDGAFQMTAMEVLTAASQQLGVVYFIFADGELSQISQAQQVPYNRKVCTVLPQLKLSAFAEAVGANYVEIANNQDIKTGIDTAFLMAERRRPVIVEVKIDYSKKTRFTEGAIKTNVARLDLPNKVRIVGRALKRKITG
jgi:acetolactate synthase I/II/III large subunit